MAINPKTNEVRAKRLWANFEKTGLMRFLKFLGNKAAHPESIESPRKITAVRPLKNSSNYILFIISIIEYYKTNPFSHAKCGTKLFLPHIFLRLLLRIQLIRVYHRPLEEGHAPIFYFENLRTK